MIDVVLTVLLGIAFGIGGLAIALGITVAINRITPAELVRRIRREFSGGSPEAPASPPLTGGGFTDFRWDTTTVMPNWREVAGLRNIAEDIPDRPARLIHEMDERIEAERQRRQATARAETRTNAPIWTPGDDADLPEPEFEEVEEPEQEREVIAYTDDPVDDVRVVTYDDGTEERLTHEGMRRVEDLDPGRIRELRDMLRADLLDNENLGG